MFSSFFPWEFINNYPHLLDEKKKGLYAFSCYDPYLEKIFLNTIPESFLDEGKWKILSPEELTISWIENNISTQDFFSNDQSVKVLMAQNIGADVQEYILKEDIDWGNKFFLLLFNKENKFFEKLKKKKVAHVLKIKEPRFWEMGNLLKFLCDQTGIRVSYDVQNLILETITNQPKEFILALKDLALLGGDPSKLSRQDAKRIISKNKLDQFELAKFWGQKKTKSFYENLLPLEGDFDSLGQIFRFMQSHAAKMVDPSYSQEKAKLSQYDKQIQSHSRLWTEGELREELRFFGECEIEAKSKSSLLIHKLRSRLIDSY